METDVDGTGWVNTTTSILDTNISAAVAVIDPQTARFEYYVHIIVPTVFTLIAVIGFIGNLLVILVVTLNRHMRNTTNILIVALAVADLLFIIICVPFTAMAFAMPKWPFGHFWCRIYQYMINVTVYAGVYTLVLMSFVRYLAIVRPLGSFSRKFRRKPYIITTIVITWTMLAWCNIPILFEYDVAEYPFYGEQRSACVNTKMTGEGNHGLLFYGCFFAFGFALPLSVICVLYGLLLRRLMRGFAAATRGPNAGQSTENPRSKRRITRMVVIIVVVFAICWFPFQAITICIHLGKSPGNSIVFSAVQLASNCLAYMNSCVNPVFYAFLSKSFRKSFCDVICCFRGRLKKRSHRMSMYQSARSHSFTASD